MGLVEVFKKIHNMTIASSIICFILGLLAFFEADLALNAVTIVFGLVFIIIGVVIILNYFADGVIRFLFGYSLLYGLLFIVAGLTMFYNIHAMYVIISIFISINLLVEFISKMQIGLILRKFKGEGWQLQIIIALILLLCSIIIVVNPAHGELSISKVVSCIIMTSALLNLVDCSIIKEKTIKIKKSLKDLVD